MKSVILKLTPFLSSFCLYFILGMPSAEPSWFTAMMKCLPILCLGIFVVAYANSLGVINSYSKKILLALMFSAIGDVCLNWASLLFYGLGIFSIAHVIYLWAFGLEPLKPWILLVLGLTFTVVYSLIYSCLKGSFVFMVGLYCVILCLMSWRAFARVQSPDNGCSWSNLFPAIGTLFFMFSDIILGRHNFCTPIANGPAFILSTYYLGQMFIAVSIVNYSNGNDEGYLFWKRS
uniref:lysoplasmalogenase n=1 Tax=Latimeria chalumnae TaxID=7897 RepID=M3XJ98_LATCH|nr:PREDICTED: lysoplasmalogenase-like protein TMEM86A [Latimeria chalumnae]XP_014354164.1 PREDICTED: lysoplasmalogenase-like protein TMEM86A [Latimeria chalumnae]XP_014354165.1 PREDICTED: lysoplasmalogenase-like protein TMEM86A [Latimeria chalumnae]|eukprot:XP_014354163.1 PREDICTED: lysoplasmalogenase-like protein TMEM86A [Latimeria chalumnae]